jgi:hypothetical protein
MVERDRSPFLFVGWWHRIQCLSRIGATSLAKSTEGSESAARVLRESKPHIAKPENLVTQFIEPRSPLRLC